MNAAVIRIGLDETKSGADLSLAWEDYADAGRRVRVGIAGVYAHTSAMKGGESLKIPEISL